MNHPSEEDFIAWRDNPVTRWVMRACDNAAERNKAAWISSSWDGGVVDPLLLTQLSTRADAYRALEQTGYKAWCELNETDEQTAAREAREAEGEKE